MTDPYDSRPETWEHIVKVRKNIDAVITNLHHRADQHDRSKLVSPEVEAFDRMTPFLATVVYGTDEYRQGLAELGPALEHHYAANSHHPEHYPDGIDGMSLLDILEMLADWKAASERTRKPTPAAPGRSDAPDYDSDFERSILLNQKRWGISGQLTAILLNTARELGYLDSGEGPSS